MIIKDELPDRVTAYGGDIYPAEGQDVCRSSATTA